MVRCLNHNQIHLPYSRIVYRSRSILRRMVLLQYYKIYVAIRTEIRLLNGVSAIYWLSDWNSSAVSIECVTCTCIHTYTLYTINSYPSIFTHSRYTLYPLISMCLYPKLTVESLVQQNIQHHVYSRRPVWHVCDAHYSYLLKGTWFESRRVRFFPNLQHGVHNVRGVYLLCDQ